MLCVCVAGKQAVFLALVCWVMLVLATMLLFISLMSRSHSVPCTLATSGAARSVEEGHSLAVKKKQSNWSLKLNKDQVISRAGVIAVFESGLLCVFSTDTTLSHLNRLSFTLPIYKMTLNSILPFYKPMWFVKSLWHKSFYSLFILCP